VSKLQKRKAPESPEGDKEAEKKQKVESDKSDDRLFKEVPELVVQSSFSDIQSKI